MKCHQEDLCQAWTWIEDAGLDGDVPSQCLMLGMAVQKKEYRKGEVSGILLGRAMMLLPPEGGGGGGGAKAVGARGESGKADEHSPNYNGHCQEATPCISGQFFCMEGLSRGSCSPLKAAKFYDGDHGCELFCGVGGSASPGEGPEAAALPVRGGGSAALLQAICYTPVPVKEPLLAPGASLDWADFATANTSALWSQQVRGDLAIMRALGANVVRVRGADGAANHRPFLDEATAQGLGVITEFGEFPYVQLKYSCLRTNMDCFAQAKSLHAAHLNSGLLSPGGGSYHSAVHTVVLMVDPDTRVQAVLSEGPGGADELKGLFIKAIVSALDGLLEAEASLKVGGALPNVTVSFSFATCEVCKHLGDKPALGQMAELREAVQRPEDYGYAPRNDLWAAYQSRFVNSVRPLSGRLQRVLHGHLRPALPGHPGVHQRVPRERPLGRQRGRAEADGRRGQGEREHAPGPGPPRVPGPQGPWRGRAGRRHLRARRQSPRQVHPRDQHVRRVVPRAHLRPRGRRLPAAGRGGRVRRPGPHGLRGRRLPPDVHQHHHHADDLDGDDLHQDDQHVHQDDDQHEDDDLLHDDHEDHDDLRALRRDARVPVLRLGGHHADAGPDRREGVPGALVQRPRGAAHDG
ncbi:unnamed protein product [Prorocentrum cordatum]|uniref:Uncharacterized protein n=1 Tax=Prorocentrum cordatum TaxID=2364126 RepID=A0ABN9S709_9DINO|nr:unnamed protein product [Polarella glacialis]